MVGVPGRSKACHNCIRRKKGCDRQLPSCGQCTRAGFSCEGYEKHRIFVHTSQKHVNTRTQHFAPETYAPLLVTKHKSRLSSPCLPSSATSLDLPWIEKSLDRVALQSQYLDNFWACFLPNGQIVSSKAADYSTAGWTRLAQDLGQRDSLVRHALLANALVLLGDQSGQQEMTVQGWRAYGKSLEMLARSLPTAYQGKGDELLISSTLLAQFELLQGARSRRPTLHLSQKWLRHACGEQSLILARGPECFTRGYAHQLFIDSRLHLIYSNLHGRKRSPFASVKWKSVPWSLRQKDPKNELLDILIEIPSVMEDFDELCPCLVLSLDRATNPHRLLLEKCLLLDSQLHQWSSTTGLTAVSFVESQLVSGHQEHSMPTSEDVATAHLGLLYWTVCLLLYQHIVQLSNSSQTQLPERVEPRQYCRKIAMFLPYFNKSNLGEFFINITAFPTNSALRFLDRNDPPDKVSKERRLLQKASIGPYKRHLENLQQMWRIASSGKG